MEGGSDSKFSVLWLNASESTCFTLPLGSLGSAFLIRGDACKWSNLTRQEIQSLMNDFQSLHDFQLASALVLPTRHHSIVRSQLPRFGAFAEMAWSTFCIIHCFSVDTQGHIAGLAFSWACTSKSVEAKWKTTYLQLGDTHPAGFSQGSMMHFSGAAVHKLENSQVCMLVEVYSLHSFSWHHALLITARP